MKKISQYKNHILGDIALARRARGYTQEELGKKVGVCAKRIYAIEGSKDAKLSTAIKLLEALDCKLVVVRGPKFVEEKNPKKEENTKQNN